MHLEFNLQVAAAAILSSLVCWQASAQEEGTSMTESPQDSAVAAVNRRIDAFNNHNLEAYLAAHHEDVLIFEYPDKAIGKGRSHLRRIFGPLIEQRIGKIDVLHQTAIDKVVVSEELLSYGGPAVHIVAIYSVDGGKIYSVRLIEPEN